MLAIIVGTLVAGGILVLFVGLAAGSPVDPVQARLIQLGSVEAKNLEELELQQPFAERTLRPLLGRLSRLGTRLTSASSTGTVERRLAMAGNPGDLKLTDWMGVKILVGIATGVLIFLILGPLAAGIVPGIFLGLVGLGIGYLLPEFWLGRRISARQRLIVRMIPDTLDLLTISVRAGLGFDAALAKATHWKPTERTEALSALTMDLQRPNPNYSSRPRPLLERNPTAFWRGLALVLALINLLLIYRLWR